MSKTEHTPPSQSQSAPASLGNPLVLGLSIAFIVLFIGLSVYNIDMVAGNISDGFAWTADVFGSYFQLLLLLTFIVALGVAFSPAANAKVGNLDKPD